MKKNIISLAIIFLLSNSLTADTKDVKVGLILPMSGEYSYVGSDLTNGLNDCLANLKTNEHVKLLIQDNLSYDRKTILSSYNHLITQNVDLTFTTIIPEVKILSARIKQSKSPFILVWDNYRTSQLDCKFSSIGYSAEQPAIDTANYAVKTQGLKKFAVLSAIDEWSEMVSSAFKNQVLKLGGEITFQESVDLQESNLKTIILRIKKSGAQAIYFPLYSTVLFNFVKQARALKLDQILLSADGFTDQVIKELHGFADGIYSYRPTIPTLAEHFSDRELEIVKHKSSFYIMGYNTCKAIEHYRVEREMPTISKAVSQTFGRIVGGKWQELE